MVLIVRLSAIVLRHHDIHRADEILVDISGQRLTAISEVFVRVDRLSVVCQNYLSECTK